MVTIKEVAEKACTSIATVSNYLNGTRPVSKEKSLNIRRAIEELNYIPNLSAKNLKSKCYNDIGVILPNFDNSYYVQLFQGMDRALQNDNYFLNLNFSYDIPDLEAKIVNDFMKKQICGLIMISCQPEKWDYYYTHFYSVNKPIVLIDRRINNLDVNLVSFNYYSTIKKITSTLIERGYQDIYLFTGPTMFSCEKDCATGFLQSHADHNLTVDKARIVQTLLNKEDAFRNTISLLKDHSPELIITTSESCSDGIIEGLTLLGKTLRDIPIITLGEDHWNHFTHSSATHSIPRPAMNIGTQAIHMMLEQMKSPKTYESKYILLDRADIGLPDNSVFLSGTTNNERPEDKIKTKLKLLLLATSQSYALLGLLPNFEKQTGIQIEYEIFPNHNYINHLLEEHNSQEQISDKFDIYMFDIPWLPYLSSSGILADISEYISFFELDKNIYFEGCLDYFGKYNGCYYGLPFMYAPQIFYYRKDLFTNPKISSKYEKMYHSRLCSPKTWTEYNAIAEYFTAYSDAVEYGVAIAASHYAYLMPEIYTRLWSYGGDIIKNGHMVFGSPQTLKAFINLKNTFKYAKPDYMTATDTSIVDDFLKGKTAMLISFPSFLSDIIDLRASDMKGNISFEHIPGKTPILGGWSMGINEKSNNKKEAFSFIHWACTKQIGKYLPLLGGYPAITDVYTNDELIQLYPWLPLCLSAYSHSRPIIPPVSEKKGQIPQYKLESVICKGFYSVLEGKTGMTEAIARTCRELEYLLK